MANEPIDEQDYIGGVTVVNIEDLRVARGLTRRPASSCRHLALRYDPKERRVWCSDCEQDVDSFDAFMQIVERFSSHAAALKKREDALAEVEAFRARTIAAKKLDEAWRRRNTVPCCPLCTGPLFPEDFKHGVPGMGREYAEAVRAKRQRK